MINLRSTIILIISCHIIFINTTNAQQKLEISGQLNVIHVQLRNSSESGLGYYDINYKRKLTQSAYLEFIYWPLKNFGISLGGCIRYFGSQMSYAITDPSNLTDEIFHSNEINFRANGHGPVVSLYFRRDQLRVGAGMSLINLSNLNYNKDSHIAGSSIFNSEGVYAHIQIDENSYWNYVPMNYVLYHLNIEYKIAESLYLKAGFETTKDNKYTIHPIRIRITGFTSEMEPDKNRVLNDFKIKDSYASLSLGLTYNIGFGRKYE
jgi:hypothetical protein